MIEKPWMRQMDAEHAEDEEKAGQIERAHQLRQRQQRSDAVLADREGHGTEGADGGHAHDHADDLEENVCGLLDHIEDQRAATAELVQREAEEDGEEEHLQDVAVGKGATTVFGMTFIRNSVVVCILPGPV